MRSHEPFDGKFSFPYVFKNGEVSAGIAQDTRETMLAAYSEKAIPDYGANLLMTGHRQGVPRHDTSIEWVVLLLALDERGVELVQKRSRVLLELVDTGLTAESYEPVLVHEVNGFYTRPIECFS